MDITVMNILDIVTEENEDGEVTKTKKIYVPTVMNTKDIQEVTPGITQDGKMYKNVSLLTKYTGDKSLVVGNYKDIQNFINRDEITHIIGYKWQKKE